MNDATAPRILSLGAGVQSTTLLLLSAEGRLPRLDAAIFADTRWESQEVYDHLDRLEREVAVPAGIPILRASTGDIRRDALDPSARYAQMPLYVRGARGEGMLRRACTAEYKLKALKQLVREILGYPYPQRIPAGLYVEQWIGISLDEASRAVGMVNEVSYMRSEFPLLFLPGGAGPTHLGWTRKDCERYLDSQGFGSTPKSACIGCPYTSNARWRRLRDERPAEWAEAVAFDERIRNGYARSIASGKPLHGEAFLHRSRVPLAQAPIDRVTRGEWAARQTDLFDELADEEQEERGCSPWACRGEDDG
ncbi:hypothetical protein ACODT3_42755 [Streptomyces sp. 4.24]|uniref:hypothetical protein n=1 Tax=Streptomyces tritrimontium TaxID=3406573 RepID=UPI003BB6B4A2